MFNDKLFDIAVCLLYRLHNLTFFYIAAAAVTVMMQVFAACNICCPDVSIDIFQLQNSTFCSLICF